LLIIAVAMDIKINWNHFLIIRKLVCKINKLILYTS
jgi:hypothetical protein